MIGIHGDAVIVARAARVQFSTDDLLDEINDASPESGLLDPHECRISRSTRTAHGLVAWDFPPQAILPSPRSAVCIIAMSVEPREIGEAVRSACPHPITLNSFLSNDKSPSTPPADQAAKYWRDCVRAGRAIVLSENLIRPGLAS